MGQEPAVFDSLMGAVVNQIARSIELVDEVYALGAKWEEEDDARMRSFAEGRARAAVHFTSSLYLTA